jgi:hypothetical protein
MLPLTKAKGLHKSFILATWVKSYIPRLKTFLSEPGSIGMEELIRQEANVAENLWTKSNVVVSPDSDFTVHAWVCGEPGKLHYVYVPPTLRLKGIATALITHVCGSSYQYGRKWPPGVKAPPDGKYNPYLLGYIDAHMHSMFQISKNRSL